MNKNECPHAAEHAKRKACSCPCHTGQGFHIMACPCNACPDCGFLDAGRKPLTPDDFFAPTLADDSYKVEVPKGLLVKE